MALRVAIITPDYPPVPGGVSISVQRIATHLARLGCRAIVLIAHLNESPRHRLAPLIQHEDGYDVAHFFVTDTRAQDAAPWSVFGLGRLQQSFLLFRRFLRAWKPNLLHSFTLFPFGTLTGLLAAQLRIPYVVSLRGNDITGNMFRPDIIGTLSIACKNARRIVAVCSELAQYASFICPEATENIRVILNGASKKVARMERVVGSANTVTFGACCFPKARKNLDVLFDAFRRLRKERSNVHLVFIGPLEDSDRLNIGGNGSVTVVGAVDHARALSLIAGLDVLVIPSTFDGCPNVLQEAMSMKRTVIASRVAGAIDLLRHGESGLLFDPLSSSELLSCMRQALSGPLRRRLGEAARKRVRSATTEAIEWLDLYEEVHIQWLGALTISELST